MNLFKRLLAACGAAGLLVGLGLATPVFAASPFGATVQLQCAVPGDTQTITVKSASGVLIHIEVTIGSSTTNGGTQNGTGLTDASGTFTDQWQVATVSTTTSAVVRIWALTSGGVAEGSNSFTIQPAGQPCASPNVVTFTGNYIDVTQVGGTVTKTCDAGVSGNAVFKASIHINVTYSSSLSTTISLPAGLDLTLACNGASKELPILPPTSVITLHESTAPTGAAAAADTNITVTASAAAITIHNAKAAATVSPTPAPTARTLAITGAQPGSAPFVWPALVLLGLLLAGAGTSLLIYRRRN